MTRLKKAKGTQEHTHTEIEQNKQYKSETKAARSITGKKTVARHRRSQELLKKLKTKYLLTPMSNKKATDSKSLERQLGLASLYLTEDHTGSLKDKKENELSICREFLDRLVKNSSLIPLEASEAPDIIATVGSAKVAIEITRFFTDSAKKGSSGNTVFEVWRSLAERIKEQLLAAGLECWYGSVFFKDDIDLTEIDRKKFVTSVVELTKKTLKGKKHLEIKPDPDSFLAPLVGFISCSHYLQAKDIGLLWWHSRLQSGPVETELTDQLTKICVNKDSIFNNQDEFQEKWLVIFARGGHLYDHAYLVPPHTNRHIQDKMLSKLPLNQMNIQNFTRIFLWDKFSETVWELWPNQQVLFHNDRQGFLVRINKIPAILKHLTTNKQKG